MITSKSVCLRPRKEHGALDMALRSLGIVALWWVINNGH